MEFGIASNLEKRKKADLLVLPYWKGKNKPEGAATISKAMEKCSSGPIQANDFTGKESEIIIVYDETFPEKRVALLGLGEKEKVTTEKLRRAYCSLTKTCRQKKIQDINLVLPTVASMDHKGIIRGVCEGLLLANYAFDQLKNHSLKDSPTVLLTKVTLIGASQHDLDQAKKYAGIAEGVYFTRDLVNGNADEVTPQHLAAVARGLAKTFPNIKATIFDKKRIEKEKMGLLLAVARGSAHDPAFIVLEYKGDPMSKEHTVIVGKGVTYDTGGLNLKPTGSMETMKCDMGGAATAFGVILAASTTGLPVNVTAVVPATENAMSALSYKPGDVYKSLVGKTVEIGNTDAEGRLILADALAYTCKHLKPTRIIDFATLTGAIDHALGAETTGLMSNDDALAEELLKAGNETYERLCRLPLYEEYRDQLKSEIADIRNIGGKGAGSITAAKFLEEFVDKKVPWAHCDIASTAFLAEARRYHPKHATGIGVRLMMQFLEQI